MCNNMKAKVSGIVIVKLMPSSSCKLKLYSVCVKNTDQYNNSLASSKVVFGTALQNIICPFSVDESSFWKKEERIFFHHHDHCNNELQKL